MDVRVGVGSSKSLRIMPDPTGKSSNGDASSTVQTLK